MKVTRKHEAFQPARFAVERCGRCHEAVVGVRKCKCHDGRMPRKAWINGILRPINGCDTCGSTIHSSCSRTVGVPR